MAEINILKLYNKAEVPMNEECPAVYPVLSYKQQVELFKILIRGRWIEFANHISSGYYIGKVNLRKHISCSSFEEALAGIILSLWSEFSETAKRDIREVLRMAE